MDERAKMDLADELAMKDELYLYMLEELKMCEEKLDDLCETLSNENRGIIWEFIMRSEDMSKRKLLLACRNMDLRDQEKNPCSAGQEK